MNGRQVTQADVQQELDIKIQIVKANFAHLFEARSQRLRALSERENWNLTDREVRESAARSGTIVQTIRFADIDGLVARNRDLIAAIDLPGTGSEETLTSAGNATTTWWTQQVFLNLGEPPMGTGINTWQTESGCPALGAPATANFPFALGPYTQRGWPYSDPTWFFAPETNHGRSIDWIIAMMAPGASRFCRGKDPGATWETLPATPFPGYGDPPDPWASVVNFSANTGVQTYYTSSDFGIDNYVYWSNTSFVKSAGNEADDDDPLISEKSEISVPGNAFNAITVGAYTWDHRYDLHPIGTDIDLRVYDPAGNFVISSTSFDDAYETVFIPSRD